METLTVLLELAGAGFTALWTYLVSKLAGAFIPAFFVAGGVGVFVPRSAVVKHLSPRARRAEAYTFASFGGALVSVCSCGIIPLFTTVYERGAGLGPAVTILFSGPSINLISLFFIFTLMGPAMGFYALLAALACGVLVGLAMSVLFGEDDRRDRGAEEALLGSGRSFWGTFHFFLFLVMMTLLLPIPTISWTAKGLWVALNATGLLVTLKLYFDREDIHRWLEKSLFLLRRILPRILLGIFFLGVLEGAQTRSPESFATFMSFVGSNGLPACLLGALLGAFLYMGSILAVVTCLGLMQVGMAAGPALAFLIAAPGVSLSTLFAVAHVLGWRKSLAYYSIAILLCAVAGFSYALVAG